MSLHPESFSPVLAGCMFLPPKLLNLLQSAFPQERDKQLQEAEGCLLGPKPIQVRRCHGRGAASQMTHAGKSLAAPRSTGESDGVAVSRKVSHSVLSKLGTEGGQCKEDWDGDVGGRKVSHPVSSYLETKGEWCQAGSEIVRRKVVDGVSRPSSCSQVEHGQRNLGRQYKSGAGRQEFASLSLHFPDNPDEVVDASGADVCSGIGCRERITFRSDSTGRESASSSDFGSAAETSRRDDVRMETGSSTFTE